MMLVPSFQCPCSLLRIVPSEDSRLPALTAEIFRRGKAVVLSIKPIQRDCNSDSLSKKSYANSHHAITKKALSPAKTQHAHQNSELEKRTRDFTNQSGGEKNNEGSPPNLTL